MVRKTPPLNPNLPMTDPKTGQPTPFFMRWWQDQVASNAAITNLSTPAEVTAVLDVLDAAAQGQVLFRGATLWEFLDPDTTGKLLTTKGAAADPVWETVSDLIDSNIGNTRGDILYRGATGWEVLAAGTADQLLSTAGPGADPLWVDAPAGGGGAGGQETTVLFDRNFSTSNLTSTPVEINADLTEYDEVHIFTDISTGGRIVMQTSPNGTTWRTNLYSRLYNGISIDNHDNSNQTSIVLAEGTSNAAGWSIMRAHTTALQPTFFTSQWSVQTGTVYSITDWQDRLEVCQDLRFFILSGVNATSGRLRVTGVKHGGGGGGAAAFTDLTDTPATLGTVGQIPAVNAGATALEWVDAPTGGGAGGAAAVNQIAVLDLSVTTLATGSEYDIPAATLALYHKLEFRFQRAVSVSKSVVLQVSSDDLATVEVSTTAYYNSELNRFGDNDFLTGQPGLLVCSGGTTQSAIMEVTGFNDAAVKTMVIGENTALSNYASRIGETVAVTTDNSLRLVTADGVGYTAGTLEIIGYYKEVAADIPATETGGWELIETRSLAAPAAVSQDFAFDPTLYDEIKLMYRDFDVTASAAFRPAIQFLKTGATVLVNDAGYYYGRWSDSFDDVQKTATGFTASLSDSTPLNGTWNFTGLGAGGPIEMEYFSSNNVLNDIYAANGFYFGADITAEVIDGIRLFDNGTSGSINAGTVWLLGRKKGIGAAGGGGASAFTDLTDTPGTLGTALQILQVNAGGTALEFIAAPPAAAAVPVQDDGVEIVASPSDLNFTGAGVIVTDVAGVATIAIAGAAPAGLGAADNNDETDATYFYFGWDDDGTGDWLIRRQTRATGIYMSATEAANPTYATLLLSWPDRVSLTYA